MKYNKYDSKGNYLGERHEQWRAGLNIGRIVRFEAGVPKGENHPLKDYTVYNVEFVNVHGKKIAFRYLVPNGKTPHQLLLDLLFLSKITPKIWMTIKLQRNEKTGLPEILALEEIKDRTQEEVEMQSLEERGGRVTLN